MKLIDADKLKERVTRLIASARKNDWLIAEDYLRKVIGIIKSLKQEQEQPKFKVGDTIHEKGENTVFPMTIERISDGDYVCNGGKCFVSIKFQDNYELIQQEQPDNEDIDKVAQELYEHLYELKRRNNVPTNLYDKQEIIDLWKAGIEYGRNHPKQEQPEVELEKEITDKSRACCNCVNGIPQYPNCYCWQHEYCNTDEPYKIPKEDWVDTAKTCKKFEHELWYSERKEE